MEPNHLETINKLKAENEELKNKLNQLKICWANRLPYKDESGQISLTLGDAAKICRILEPD